MVVAYREAVACLEGTLGEVGGEVAGAAAQYRYLPPIRLPRNSLRYHWLGTA